jgi:regulator of protease activity HflC (stomatin/prohibitin superfamily)
MGCCFSCVENGTVGLVTQCGAFKRIATPGFNCICCCTGEMVQDTLNLRQQQLNVELETKTKDDVSVKVVVSVQYLISNDKDYSHEGSYYKAYYKLNDPELQIRSYVLNVVRSAIPKISLDGVFESKDEIAEKVRMDLSSSMSQFGYVIVNTLVTDIEPAAQVKAAMNEINAATRMRKVAIEKAEAQKTRIVKDAEADAEAKYLAGTGIMRQRQAIVNGLRESVKVFSEEVKDVTSKDVMDMMILTQYFDVLKDLGAGAKSSAVFIPHSPAGVSDVSGAVRNGVLQARPT